MRGFWLAIALMAGCNSGTVVDFPQCALDVALSPTEAVPGGTVAAIGGPLSQYPWDHAVRVGGKAAEVVDVSRNDACTDCDACFELEECNGCEVCPSCADTCAGCIQSVSFEVPDLPAGPADVVITNAYGASPSLVLTILDSGDTGR